MNVFKFSGTLINGTSPVFMFWWFSQDHFLRNCLNKRISGNVDGLKRTWKAPDSRTSHMWYLQANHKSFRSKHFLKYGACFSPVFRIDCCCIKLHANYMSICTPQLQLVKHHACC
jgi:hypothetical protein